MKAFIQNIFMGERLIALSNEAIKTLVYSHYLNNNGGKLFWIFSVSYRNVSLSIRRLRTGAGCWYAV